MLDSIEKAKQTGIFFLERIGDYLDLAFIEMEIRINDMGVRALNTALSVLFLFLACIFLGLAVIVTSWDSGSRIPIAWAVFFVYLLAAIVCYFLARRAKMAESPVSAIQHELKQDIQILKDRLKPH